jgi:hypothetical protein
MEDIGLTKINMNIKNMEGDCLCGAVRYCVSGSPFATEYCHCGMCQKASWPRVVGGCATSMGAETHSKRSNSG